MGMMMRSVLMVFVLLLAGCRSIVGAQEIRVVDGQKYIAHTVLKGQTLYAIGRHYAVPVEAITQANPAAKQGLSLGQVLLIPVKAQVKKELKTAPAFVEGELAHTVAKKETLFGIAHKYGVSESDLQARNPELANGLRPGMIVMIPVGKVTSVSAEQVAPPADDRSTPHLVQPGETIYSLSKRYDLTPEEIQAANGGLPEGLKAGTYVRIPAKASAPEPVVTPAPARPPGEVARVALLLPFSIAANDSAMARAKEPKGMYAVTDAAVQFYAGTRMALDSMERLGMSVDLSVFDVGEDAGTWTPVLKDPAVRNADLCLGPFHRAAIEQLTRNAPTAHVVCPAPQSNKVLLGNPNVSKVLSGRPDQLQQLAHYVATHHAKDNIVLCSTEIPADKELRDQIFRVLQEVLAEQHGKLRDTVLVVRSTKRDIADVIAKLSGSQNNVVIAASEDIEYVTALVRKLAGLSKDKRIVLYGLNSWTGMETLEAADLEALKTCIPASTWIDHEDPRVQRFVRDYRALYQNEPGEYAFLGFDVSYFYLTALHQFGPDFPTHFAEVVTEPLHMSFKLFKSGVENGYRNENAVMLQYQEAGLRKAP
jgi:LysM repeat protein/ABC-type branched-subunit amino acid transport system substrate-binding protein